MSIKEAYAGLNGFETDSFLEEHIKPSMALLLIGAGVAKVVVVLSSEVSTMVGSLAREKPPKLKSLTRLAELFLRPMQRASAKWSYS